jgi:hypothetical protein
MTPRRVALERDVFGLHAITEAKPTASRDSVGFHPPELIIIVTEEVKKGHYPNIGLAKMSEDAQKGDRIGIEVQEGKTIKIQDQQQKFRRGRQESSTDEVLCDYHTA